MSAGARLTCLGRPINFAWVARCLQSQQYPCHVNIAQVQFMGRVGHLGGKLLDRWRNGQVAPEFQQLERIFREARPWM
jgi:hypothetical protein